MIKNLDKMNVRMLCKWWWKVENDEELWQYIIQAKYLQRDPLLWVNIDKVVLLVGLIC
jgi:hypothetical protein